MENQFFNVLKELQKRPGMYMGEVNLKEAICFVAGMNMIFYHPLTMRDGEPGFSDRDFSQWIYTEKLKQRPSACSWMTMIPVYFEKEEIGSEDEIKAFFDLFFEFLEDQNSPE